MSTELWIPSGSFTPPAAVPIKDDKRTMMFTVAIKLLDKSFNAKEIE